MNVKEKKNEIINNPEINNIPKTNNDLVEEQKEEKEKEEIEENIEQQNKEKKDKKADEYNNECFSQDNIIINYEEIDKELEKENNIENNTEKKNIILRKTVILMIL